MKSLIITLSLLTPTLGVSAEKDINTPNIKFEKGWDDIEAEDYSHLTIPLPTIKPEENGLPELAKIAEELSEKYQYSSLIGNYDNLSDEELWQKKAEIFEKISTYYEKIDAELEKSHLYESYDYKIDSSSPNTIRMISLSRYLQLRTVIHARAGDKQKAWASHQQELKLATKLRAHCNNLVTKLVCIAVEATMFESADNLLLLASDDSEFRSKVISIMRRKIEHQECMRKAMLGEFIHGANALEVINSGEITFNGLMMGDFDTTSDATFWDAVCQPKKSNATQYLKGVTMRKSMQIGMQPNRTLKVMHERYLHRCKMLKMKPYEINEFEKKGSEELIARKRNLFSKPSSNIVGEGILAITTPIIDKQIIKIYIQPVAIEMVILRDAMRRYKRKNGSYPTNLHVLVPEFIEKIPVDIFSKDQKHIQYDAKIGLLWSVGSDGVSNLENQSVYGKPNSSTPLGLFEEHPYMYLDSSSFKSSR